MTELSPDNEPAETRPAGNCIHCGQVVMGRYCHACGQDNAPHDRTILGLVRDGAAELFNLDGKVFATIRSMALDPGALLVAWRDGRNQAFVSPVKLFLVVSAAFFVVLVWGNLAIHQFVPLRTGNAPVSAELTPHGVRLIGGEVRDLYLSPVANSAPFTELTQALDRLRPFADTDQRQAIDDMSAYVTDWQGVNEVLDAWMPRLLWLLMPVYALLLWPIFGPRRPLAEHLVFALWAHCLIFILLMLLAALNWVGLQLNFWLLTIPYLAFFTLAARRYYGGRWWILTLKGLGHIVLFFCVAWLPAGPGLAYSQIVFPDSYWMADNGEGEAIDRWVLAPEEWSLP